MRIVVANRKGGCGKTMLSLNIAGTLAAHGKRILLFDLDPQASLSEILHRYADQVSQPLSNTLLAGDLAASITPTHIPAIDFVPADEHLSEINRGVDPHSRRTIRGRERLLANLLARSETTLSQYDMLIFDTPPDTRGDLTSTALVVADLVVVPIDPHAGARGAAVDILTLVEELQPFSDRTLHLALILNRIKMQTGSYDLQAADAARDAFGDSACKTIVPSWLAFPKAAEDGMPVAFVRGSDFNRAASVIYTLLQEVDRRLDGQLELPK
ncbi:MAG: ParA family protein [Anaerolineales bacterium]|nr:ParA family protein [Anaerolineales bacterium]MCB9128996.1 ParA family protein [Ardenticatenales bacterium]